MLAQNGKLLTKWCGVISAAGALYLGRYLYTQHKRTVHPAPSSHTVAGEDTHLNGDYIDAHLDGGHVDTESSKDGHTKHVRSGGVFNSLLMAGAGYMVGKHMGSVAPPTLPSPVIPNPSAGLLPPPPAAPVVQPKLHPVNSPGPVSRPKNSRNGRDPVYVHDPRFVHDAKYVHDPRFVHDAKYVSSKTSSRTRSRRRGRRH